MNIKNTVKISALLITFFTIINNVTLAETLHFSNQTEYQACFTPGQNCTQLIVDQINQAKNSVYVQAYSFTSAPIAKAIVDAKKRGLDVRVILDKSQVKNNRYSSAKFLVNQGVPVAIDNKVAIAHNKVMLIDSNTVITGSFNFTKAAEMRNAENVLVIADKNLFKKYNDNWLKRMSQSVVFSGAE